MSIYRTVHNKENPYYIKNRAAVSDKRLSFKAKGIHDYLMSKPDNWTVNESELESAATDGLSAVKSGVQELLQYGYMSRVKVDQDPDTGRFGGYETHVYETPELNPMYSPTCDFPTSEKPTVGKSHTNKYSLVNNDLQISSNSRANAPFANAKAPAAQDAALPSSLFDVPEKEDTPTKAIAKSRKVKTNNPPAARPPTAQQELFQAVCDAVGWDAKTCNAGQVSQMVGKLNAGGYTPANVRTWREDIWPESYPGSKGGNPTLNQLGNGIAEVKHTAFVQQPSTDWNAIFASL